MCLSFKCHNVPNTYLLLTLTSWGCSFPCFRQRQTYDKHLLYYFRTSWSQFRVTDTNIDQITRPASPSPGLAGLQNHLCLMLGNTGNISWYIFFRGLSACFCICGPTNNVLVCLHKIEQGETKLEVAITVILCWKQDTVRHSIKANDAPHKGLFI